LERAEEGLWRSGIADDTGSRDGWMILMWREWDPIGWAVRGEIIDKDI